MNEIRALALVALGGVLALPAILFGLGAVGATNQQIASAWVISMVITGAVGSFVFMHYNSPPDDRR